MKTIFTENFNHGCYSEKKAKDLLQKRTEFSISDVLNSEIPLKDKVWFIRVNCQLTDTELREFAIGCALCVLPIYESKYPENKAPREAIEAAKAYLNKEIGLDDLRVKRQAAAAYAAAAAAAYDAAADAAAYAADAADAADINYKDILLQFFKEFTKC